MVDRGARLADVTASPTARAWATVMTAGVAARADQGAAAAMYGEALALARSVANASVESMINMTSARALSGIDNPLITLDLVTRTARDLHRAGWHMQTSQALIGTIRVLGRIGDHEAPRSSGPRCGRRRQRSSSVSNGFSPMRPPNSPRRLVLNDSPRWPPKAKSSTWLNPLRS